MNNYLENRCNCNYKDNSENLDFNNRFIDQNYYERRDVIKNKSAIEFEGCNKKVVIESNEVEAQKIKLRIKEEQSCRLAFEGETIGYKIKICNDSDMDIFNCEFKDFLDRNSEFVRNSFRINGKCETPCIRDNIISFNMRELKDHSETTITFEAKVK